jgi:ABC-2 type transport system permease protein
MRALRALIVANIKSFTRDRSAVFWTLAFPILFVILFGSIFSGGSTSRFDVGWVDLDGSQGSAQLRAGFAATKLLNLSDVTQDAGLDKMRTGDLDAVIVVPAGFAAAVAATQSGSATASPLTLTVYTDPSQSTQSGTIQQIVGQVVGAANQFASGKPPVLVMQAASVQTENLSAAAYFVPSILAMALMQLGIFSAVPLVQQREKLILKRLSATPLRRSQLVSSNIVMRLLIAAVQAALIIGIGVALFGVTMVGSLAMIAGFIVLGAVAFIAIGYVIASFAKTEESANAMTSVVQFPLMFLSGIFIPIALMPAFLQPVAALMPLTYLGDALRQVMVGGVPYAPLPVDAAVLAAWLIGSFLISARWFRWQ